MQDKYDLAFKLYPYKRCRDQDASVPVRHPVVVMGGGPVGLGIALDLGLQGIPVIVLDDHEGIGTGSRAICFAKRTLEIMTRYGCGHKVVDKGVLWNLGKVFQQDRKIFEFNLLPEDGHKHPAFVNLQQPYFEKFLYEQICEGQTCDGQSLPVSVRGKNRVEDVICHDDYVSLEVNTPQGPYTLEAEWLIGCDGASSPLRSMLNLDFEGRVFEDNFLIADVRMKADFPTERWFWFEPSFKESGSSALLHKQPDDIWRIDFQIGWDIDRKQELAPEKIKSRLDAMLGLDVDYDIVWTSIYTFQCRRMKHFRHNRVVFAGDSAHQVSPFGAGGANSGMQDVDNLGWKLGLVLNNKAPHRLLDTYDEERVFAADENILNSTRSTDFITPKTPISKVFRNAVLDLAERYDFARPLVNSGRLSLPSTYDGSSLNGSDDLPHGPQCTRVGSPCPDAVLSDGYLLDYLGFDFVLLAYDVVIPDDVHFGDIRVRQVALTSREDKKGFFKDRYVGKAGSAVYLIRPDQHVAARWQQYDEDNIKQAILKAIGQLKV